MEGGLECCSHTTLSEEYFGTDNANFLHTLPFSFVVGKGSHESREGPSPFLQACKGKRVIIISEAPPCTHSSQMTGHLVILASWHLWRDDGRELMTR